MIESNTGLDQHAAELRAALVDDLVARGALPSARWRHAFQTVPRHVFVPRFLHDPEHDSHYVTISADDPDQREEWLRHVYTDQPLATQLDGDMWVSSSSQPSLMAQMLEALDIRGSERVLEIGTGTGYNAALLCEGLDAGGQVVSVDIDGALVEAARTRLSGLGYAPTLATVDGTAGFPDAAAYDRIIATCSLPHVPLEWIAQTAEGGLILLNLWRDLGGGALALLRVEGGHASGRFLPYYGGFMPTRTLQHVSGSELLAAHTHDHGVEAATTITRDVFNDPAFAMVAGLRIDARYLSFTPDGQPEQNWLLARDGSWAYQTTNRDGELITVQDRPGGLWDQLEAAYQDWTTLGRPAREEFGLTVAKDGDHVVWYQSPSGPAWRL